MADDHVCASCNLQIEGQVYNAKGVTFHKECFTCTACKKSLLGASCGQRDGQFYCQPCYMSAFAKTCEKCKKVIMGKSVEVGGKAWCEEHLTCAKCDKKLDNFRTVDGKTVCEDCYLGGLKSYDCHACEKTIDYRELTEALGLAWHIDCFVCCKDSEKLDPTAQFYEHQGKLYCQKHWDEANLLDTCAACSKVIEHDYVKVCGKTFHTSCWTCGGCKKIIQTADASQFDGKFFCTKCAVLEEAKRKDGKKYLAVAAKRLIRGYGEYEAAPGTVPPSESKRYPLKTLQLRPPLIPKEIDFRQREQYLDDKEFKQVFGVGIHVFNRYPLWRRLQLKKQVGLF